MAHSSEDIDINLVLNAAESAKSLRDMKKALKDVKDAAASVGEGSKGYDKLIAKAGELTDEINDANQAVKALAGSNLENLTGGFANMAATGIKSFRGLVGANAIFGKASEDTLKTLEKLESLASMAEGIKGFAELGKQVKVFGTALKTAFSANPVFLIIAAVAALALAIKELTDYFSEDAMAVREAEEAYEELKKTSELLEVSYSNKARLIHSEIELMKVQGKSQKEINAKIKEENEYKIKGIEISIKQRKAGLEIIKLQQKQIVATDDLIEAGIRLAISTGQINEELGNKAIQKHRLDRLRETVDEFVKATQEIETAETDLAVLRNENKTAAITNEKEVTDKFKKNVDERLKKLDTEEAERKKKIIADADAEIAENLRIFDEKVKKEKEWQDFLKSMKLKESETNKENSALELQNEIDLIKAKKDLNLGDLLRIAELEKKLAELRKKNKDDDLKDDQDKWGKKLGIAQHYINATMDLEKSLFEFANNIGSQSTQAKKERAKAQFNIEKGLAIGSALVNGGLAIVKDLDNPPKMIFDGLITAAQVAAIASRQFSDTGGGSGTVSVNTGSGSAGRLNQTPQLQKVGSGFQNPLSPSSKTNSSKKQEPLKAFVISKDITTAQNKNAIIERRAIFKSNTTNQSK